MMITGDHPATALAIARRLGIVTADDTAVLTGVELALMDERVLHERVAAVRVYARVDPTQKKFALSRPCRSRVSLLP